MVSLSDIGIQARRRGRGMWRNLTRMRLRMPKGLYARSIIIVVTPIVLLQSVVAYVFMERHWQTVTRRLSNAVTGDIAAIVQVIDTYPQDENFNEITRIAAESLGLNIAILPPGDLPPVATKPFFSLLDRTLSRKISEQIGQPFWIDTVGRSNIVEIRIKFPDKILRVFARRSQTYASNSEIFLFWMVGTSLVLIAIALLFLRNQIRPIVTLADAMESFGKGRAVETFTLRGAREVRQASQAFFAMRERIERQIEQRTTMLSGVSHDLRTVLTRFQLELAMLEEIADTGALQADIAEMGAMLEEYIAFARGDAAEESAPVNVQAALEEIADRQRGKDTTVTLKFGGEPVVDVRPVAFRRCLSNLVANAGKYANTIAITARHRRGWLTVTIDDDGPGIPEAEREAVFRPFYRLDEGRNVDQGGSGLGLSIALDTARSHGGQIELEDGPLGGLRARVRIPA